MSVRKRIGKFLGPRSLDEVHIVELLLGAEPGTMFDVGAHYGNALAPFLDRGWTVYAFEPDPENRRKLSTSFPMAKIDPRAVSDRDDDELDLFTSEVSAGISTLSPFHASHTPTAKVTTVRLDSYIRDNGVTNVDFLKVDVEGFDLYVLRSFPWHSHAPKAVVCEFEDKKTKQLGHTVHDIALLLEQRGYRVLVSEWQPIVEYGRRHVWKRFADYPAELSEESWGNLIAVRPDLYDEVKRCAGRALYRLRLRRAADRLRGAT